MVLRYYLWIDNIDPHRTWARKCIVDNIQNVFHKHFFWQTSWNVSIRSKLQTVTKALTFQKYIFLSFNCLEKTFGGLLARIFWLRLSKSLPVMNWTTVFGNENTHFSLERIEKAYLPRFSLIPRHNFLIY